MNQHCKNCGTCCQACERCAHCGHCKSCGKYVAQPYYPYVPYTLAPQLTWTGPSFVGGGYYGNSGGVNGLSGNSLLDGTMAGGTFNT